MDRFEGNADPDARAKSDGSSKSLPARANAPEARTREAGDRSELVLGPLHGGASDPGARARPPRLKSFFGYVSMAIMAACLLGFGWAAGSHLFGPGGAFAAKPSSRAAVSQESLDRAELVRSTRKMTEDLRLLKTDVESLRATLAQSVSANNQHALDKGLDGLKTRLDAAKTETGAAIADLATKVEHLQRDPAAKLGELSERLERIERQTAAPLVTGSIAPVPIKASPGLPLANRTKAEPPQVKPQTSVRAKKAPELITSWVVRDAYDGIALVENARGSIEVALGETIPGAGTVKAIERRGDGWIVITSRGLIDSARDNLLP
jgi:regulator of replication initiation timing